MTTVLKQGDRVVVTRPSDYLNYISKRVTGQIGVVDRICLGQIFGDYAFVTFPAKSSRGKPFTHRFSPSALTVVSEE